MPDFNRVRVEDHGANEIIALNGEVLAASATAVTVGIDMSAFEAATVGISTTAACTIRPQISDDDVNWYDVKTAADADISFACNNEKIAFAFPMYGRYIRVTVTDGGSGSTVTAVICLRS